MKLTRYLTVPIALAAGALQPAAGHDQAHGRAMAIYAPAEIVWKNAPPTLPPGARVAVLEGDPSKEGPFTMRLAFPDGYRIAPHTHPQTERITVISGVFNLGMGPKFDASATRAMPAGAFGTWAAGMAHFVWVQGETVVQLNGIGPWSIAYVDPADDPRTAKK